MATAADAVQDSSNDTETGVGMAPTAQQQQRASAPAVQAVTEASPKDQETPGFLSRAWQSITSPTAIPSVATSTTDLPPVLQAVMPPKEDRVAAGAGFAEGFRQFLGTVGAVGAAAPPEYGGMSDQDTSQQMHQQNVQKAQEYNQKYGTDPDAQNGLMLAQMAIGLPAAIAAPELAAAIARGARLPGVVGDFLAGSAGEQTGGLPGLATRFGSRATSGAIGGGAAGGVTADPSQDLGKQITDSAINSGLLAPVIGATTDIATEGAKRLSGQYIGGRLPNGDLPATVQARAPAAQILQDNGVTVTGSQVTNDPLSSSVASYGGKVPGSGAGPFATQQQQQFRGGAMRFMGEPDSTLATPQVMQDNRDRIGHLFDGASNTDIPIANLGSLGQVGNDLRLAPPSVTTDLTPVLRDITSTIQRNGGVLPGNFYQGYVQSGSALQKIAAGDSQAAPYAQQIIDALHDGMERSATGQVLQDVQTGRQQTRAWYAINTASRGSGDGSFNADQLHAATTSQQQRFGNSRGIMDDYADAGKTILGSPPPSAAPPSGGAAGLALALKVLGAFGAGSAAVAAPITLPINRGLQAVNRAAGPRAVQTIQGGGGTPISPWVQQLQRALPALFAPSRPQNFPPS